MNSFYGTMCIVTNHPASSIALAFKNDTGPEWDFGASLLKCFRDNLGGITKNATNLALKAIGSKWCIDKATLDAAKTFPKTVR